MATLWPRRIGGTPTSLAGEGKFLGTLFFHQHQNPVMWSNNFLFHFTKPANSGFIELIKDIYQLHDIILY